MIKKLIINADDFGMTRGVTAGILLAHKEGILTSTTCMMNMPYAKWALEEAKKYPNLGVGVHLVLTVGKPLVDGAISYTDSQGRFIRPDAYSDGQPHADEKELYLEWKAQIDKYIEITGHKPTHIDSHHYVHSLPWHHQVAKRLSKEYDIPMRQDEQIIDHYEYIPFTKGFYADRVTISQIKSICEQHEGSLEIMCHPGFVDQPLYDMTSYALPRMKELEILTSPEMKTFIEDNHIQLINYSNIKKNDEF